MQASREGGREGRREEKKKGRMENSANIIMQPNITYIVSNPQNHVC